MAFQFINTTAEKREPDKKTRKRIRSQVMKDYRRRKEEADDGSFVAEASLRPDSPLPGPSISRSSSTKPAMQKPVSTEGTSPLTGALGERSTKRGRPNKSEQERAARLFLKTAHGLFSNFTIDICKHEHIEEEVHIASNDAEASRIIAIRDKFNEWMILERTQLASFVKARQEHDTESSMLQLYAIGLMSIGHLSAIGVYEGDEERAYYKARLLELANKSLQDPAKACEDAILSALACLASYEISLGSHEALTHLSGLSRMIEWRGGIDNISSDSGLPVLLQVLDLLHAVSFHVAPVYTKTTTNATNDTHNDFPAVDSMDAAHEWQDLLREAASFFYESDNFQASRACFLAWRVLLFQPRAGSVWTEQSIEEMQELYRLMLSMPNDAWAAYPALQARVLLTALATDTDNAHKSWCYSHLSHLMFHTEAKYWNDLHTLVTSFINAQAQYRRPRVQTVRAMVSGVEIVIERSLAAQFGLQTVQS
ncbi:hypothetical protein AMS68_003363 [Peltaster fructicola]|uniref:Uncharacterized protein n=1 Tax=Peltaster fructicola TaxID=286661 RepID=A0A6H0XT41_9PEZI|nr:hypothetical protein AMS68_003363 [Peltaster fructicola]